MFEVRSYIGNELQGSPHPDYLTAASEASKLADKNGEAYVVNEIVRRCIVTPTKLVKT